MTDKSAESERIPAPGEYRRCQFCGLYTSVCRTLGCPDGTEPTENTGSRSSA